MRIAGNSVVNDEGERNTFNVEVMTMAKKSNEKNMVEEIAWLLDSDYSDHIVNSDKYFSTSVKLETPVDIKVGDDFSLKSDKIGNITTFLTLLMNKLKLK